MLRCGDCGSPALRIIDQGYSESVGWEEYECEDCGATGTLTMRDDRLTGPENTMSGSLDSI